MKQNTTQAASQGADGSGLDSAQVPTVDVDVDGRRQRKVLVALFFWSLEMKFAVAYYYI